MPYDIMLVHRFNENISRDEKGLFITWCSSKHYFEDKCKMFFLLTSQNIGSLITVNGSILFVGNDASSDEGGALYIMEFGQMRMLKGSKMEFVDNKGRYVHSSDQVMGTTQHNIYGGNEPLKMYVPLPLHPLIKQMVPLPLHLIK